VLTSLRPTSDENNDKAEDRSKSREKPNENIGYESFDGIATKAPVQQTTPTATNREAPPKNKPADSTDIRPVTKKTKAAAHELPKHNFKQSTGIQREPRSTQNITL